MFSKKTTKRKYTARAVKKETATAKQETTTAKPAHKKLKIDGFSCVEIGNRNYLDLTVEPMKAIVESARTSFRLSKITGSFDSDKPEDMARLKKESKDKDCHRDFQLLLDKGIVARFGKSFTLDIPKVTSVKKLLANLFK